MTKIIAILSQKGGVGKTTLTNNLGMAFKKFGKNVLLVDSDPQGSLRDWNDTNNASLLPVIGLDRGTLSSDLEAVKGNYDLIIIDGSPRADKVSSAAIRIADIVLIPTTPSSYDVWASADLVDIIKARQEVTEGKPIAYFAINRIRKNTRLGNEIYDVIDGYGLPIIKQGITDFEIYKQTAARGETVYQDRNAQKAIEEIENIKNELMEILYA